MRTRILIAVLTLCSISFADCTQGQWIVFDCPEEGITVKTPRNVSAAYSIYGRRYEQEYRASENAIEALHGENGSADSLRAEISKFKEYLVRERRAIQTRLRTTVSELQKAPCDKGNRKAFDLLLETVNFSANQLRKITVACSDTTSDIRTMLQEYQSDKE